VAADNATKPGNDSVSDRPPPITSVPSAQCHQGPTDRQLFRSAPIKANVKLVTAEAIEKAFFTPATTGSRGIYSHIRKHQKVEPEARRGERTEAGNPYS
jgi:hypothetical protein